MSLSLVTVADTDSAAFNECTDCLAVVFGVGDFFYRPIHTIFCLLVTPGRCTVRCGNLDCT